MELLLVEVRRSVDAQKARWDQLDARVRFLMTLIGAAATILGLGVGKAIPIGTDNPLSRELAIWAGVSLGYAVLVLIVTYFPQGSLETVRPSQMVNEYLEDPVEVTKLTLLDTLAAAYDDNQALLRRTNLRFRVAFGGVALAGFFSVCSLIVPLLGWS